MRVSLARIAHLIPRKSPFINLSGKFPFKASAMGYSHPSMPAHHAIGDESAIGEENELEETEPKNVDKSKTRRVGVKRSLQKASQDDRPVEEIYQKKTQLEHILLRPDTYIGSVERQEMSQWVYDRTNGKMVQRNLSFVPGLFKIFDEILVNAADNKVRDPSMDTLKVDIDKENGKISIYNNGKGIPIEMHSKEGIYVPELIFGHLLTSSNYNDKEKKVTGGRNGYGAKLCNIFSTEFIVETADSFHHRKYKQVFAKNMNNRGEPLIGEYNREDYTKISFKPDLSKFGMTNLDDDIISLFERRVYDMAGCIRNVKIYLNGERINIRTFKDYVELFMPKVVEGSLPPPTIVQEKIGDRWEICVAAGDGSFQQMSFVNAICTYKGGAHVSYITDQIAAAVGEQIKKKSKDMASVKPAQIKNHLMVFINCLIENPTFDSQTKEYMTLRSSAFGSECKLGPEFIKKVLKCGIVENVMSWAKFKQNQQLKKTDGTKRTRLSGIAKLDDANNAGTKNAAKCTLIITEGDSAKALAVSGLSVVGRDNYGVFPLRGKLLNVREATHKQIMENAEITQIKQILGLQHGQSYTSICSLRYGSLMIMTDQDYDGSHIKGLVINFIDHFFPSLLKIPGFLVEFITPIVKVTRGREEIPFYTIPEYETWKLANSNGKGWNIKYYKGLGTSTAADAKRYFAAMDKHRKSFAPANEIDRQLVDMAFNRKKADERKEWLKACVPNTFVDHSAEVIKISDFINKELILFSMADNARSIPSMVDGLKPGHRKILFGCFKRKLKAEIKVAQLAGYVSEHSAYHHGEQSLCSTIVGMAQSFVGSNNLNLLEPNGQFGTRLQGGKDAASPRYIFTSLSSLARLLFRTEDDALLKYLNDDGQSIEPEWYIPILPLVLVNGGEGIGTGWMTAIPNYNPRDIVQNLRLMMEEEVPEPIHPWYHGFQGTVEPHGPDRYKISGIWRKVGETTLEIAELPIGTWTQNYKEMLEQMLGGDKGAAVIKDYKEYHTDTTVRFVINFTPEGMAAAEAEGIEKKFKLSTTINLNNLICFDSQGKIRRYASPLSILDEFYHLRLEYYGKRKELLAQQLTTEWTRLDNKVRFIQEIIGGQLIVQNRRKADIILDLTKRGYVIFDGEGSGTASAEEEVKDEDEASASTKDTSSSGYDYLLRMPIYSLTREKVTKLMADRTTKETELNALLAKKPKDLWKSDLDEFMVAWDAFERESNMIFTEERAKSMGKATAIRKTQRNSKPKITKLAIHDDYDNDNDDDDNDDDDDDDNDDDDDDGYGDGGKELKVEFNAKHRKLVKGVPRMTSAKRNLPARILIENVKAAQPQPIGPAKALTDEEVNDLPLAERINYMLSRGVSSAVAASAKPSQPRQTTLDSLPTRPSATIAGEQEYMTKPVTSAHKRRIIDSDDEDHAKPTKFNQAII